MSLSEKLAGRPIRRIYQAKPLPFDFGPWRPDLPAFLNPGLVRAENCMPHYNGYKEFPGLDIPSTATAPTKFIRGAGGAKGDDGNHRLFAGDENDLYSISNTFALTEISKSTGAYSVPDLQSWEFVRFQDFMLATNKADPLQSFTLSSSSDFADHITSTLKPQAKHIGVVRDRFVVLGFTNESSTDFPRRIRWSAIDDSTDFDASGVTLSGFQDLQGRGGEVRKVIGGRDYGLIFQENEINRMEFVGAPEIFQLIPLESNRGALLSNSVVPIGRINFFLSNDGWQVTDGTESRPIGEGKFDRDFFDQLDDGNKHRLVGGIFFEHSLLVVAYPTVNSPDGTPNVALVYHWPTGEAAELDIDVQFIIDAVTAGVTIDGLDNFASTIDDLPFALDSAQYTGGNPFFGGFNSDGKLGTFDGTPLTAIFTMGEKQLFGGKKAMIKAVRPFVDGASSTVSVDIATRNTFQETETYGSARNPDSNGVVTFRDRNIRARYHTFRVTVSGGFDDAQGIQVEASEGGYQ